MKTKYIVKVQAGQQCNPEYEPDDRMRNGIEANGYLVVMFDEAGNPIAEGLSGVSTLDIARYLAADVGNVTSILNQASAIADGLITANEIKKNHDKKTMVKGILDSLE